MTAKQRPGVYSDYTVSGILWGSGQNKDVAIVGINTKATKNTVYEIKRVSDAVAIFGIGALVTRLCTIALANGANKIQAVSCGSGSTQDYTQAFSAISNIKTVGAVICDNETQSINTLLKESVTASSQNSYERIGIVSCAASYIDEFVGDVNCERIIAFEQKCKDETDETLSGCFLAAAVAGTIVASTDPTKNFNAIPLKSVNSLNTIYNEIQIDVMLENGIAVFETVAGSIELIRAVSTRTKTDGLDDPTFHDINTVLVIDNVISSIRGVLKEMLANSRNNESTKVAISTQTIIELENKKKEGLIESYLQPRVYSDSGDPTVCIVELSFIVSHTLNQIQITAYIKV